MTRQETVWTALLCGVCLALVGLQLWPRMTVQTSEIEITASEIDAAIDGAVLRPGSYTLPFGSTVADLVEAAGGMASNAAPRLVNPADPLTHGELVIVPERHDPEGERRVNVNAASLEDLQGLPGVGPVTAAKIVSGRPYMSVEDLLKVPGIGPKTLERLRPHLGL